LSKSCAHYLQCCGSLMVEPSFCWGYEIDQRSPTSYYCASSRKKQLNEIQYLPSEIKYVQEATVEIFKILSVNYKFREIVLLRWQWRSHRAHSVRRNYLTMGINWILGKEMAYVSGNIIMCLQIVWTLIQLTVNNFYLMLVINHLQQSWTSRPTGATLTFSGKLQIAPSKSAVATLAAIDDGELLICKSRNLVQRLVIMLNKENEKSAQRDANTARWL